MKRPSVFVLSLFLFSIDSPDQSSFELKRGIDGVQAPGWYSLTLPDDQPDLTTQARPYGALRRLFRQSYFPFAHLINTVFHVWSQMLFFASNVYNEIAIVLFLCGPCFPRFLTVKKGASGGGE